MSLIEWINEKESQTDWKDRDHAIYDDEDIRTKTLKILGITIYKTIQKGNSRHRLNEFAKDGHVGGFASSLFDKTSHKKTI